jgi:hypothetical protein
MSKTTDWVLSIEDTADDRHLAKLLGISYDELIKLDWEYIENLSEQGHFTSYTVKFSGNSPQEILQKIDRLSVNNEVILEPWELEAEYDYINDQFDAITESKINIKEFQIELKKIHELSQLQKDGDKLKKILNRQVFISIIGTLETFLSETFMKLVFSNGYYFEAFIENHPIFKSEKFELREVFRKHEEINKIAKKVILDTIFHNLPTVREMYRNTFKIQFPSIGELSKFIKIRHDLVHRNGKSKDGEKWIIDDKLIDDLIEESTSFVDKLCIELKIK